MTTFTAVDPSAHAYGYGREQLRPLSLPANPLPKPKSKIGKEALALHQAAQDACKRIQEARDAETEAVSAWSAAKQSLLSEIQRGGRDGRDADAEQELSAEVARLELLAQPNLLAERKSAAQAASDGAITAFQRFVTENASDLIAELAPEAEKASADLVAIIEKVKPIEDTYKEVHERVRQLVILAYGFDERWNLADVPAPPLPNRALWDASHVPDPEDDAEVAPPQRVTMDRQTGEFVRVDFEFAE